MNEFALVGQRSKPSANPQRVAQKIFRRFAASTAAALLLFGGLAILGLAPSASAATCPDTKNVYITGGESHYTLTCSGGYIYVDGRVKDTRVDGMCVQVKALIDGYWFVSEAACGYGTTKWFSWHNTGSTAYVYTYTV